MACVKRQWTHWPATIRHRFTPLNPIAPVAAQQAAIPGQTTAGTPVTSPVTPIIAAHVLSSAEGGDSMHFDLGADDAPDNIPARGEWVNWIESEDNERRLRLSWISPLGTRFLFTNRQGENGLGLTRSEVETFLASGRLQRLHEDQSATERALNHLMAG